MRRAAALLAVPAVVLAIVVAGLGLGLGRQSGMDGHHEVPPPTVAADERPARRRPDVTVAALPGGGFAPGVAVVDHLADGDVRFLRVVGLPPGADGRAAQCVLGEGGDRACAPAVPAHADRRGRAELLFQFAARVGPADCTGGAATCVVLVEAGGAVALLRAVFGAAAPPPPRVEVTPTRGLRPGDEVTVRLSEFPPSAPVAVSQCVPGSGRLAGRCGEAGSTVPVVVDGSGQATVRYRVDEGGACRRGRPCALGVVGTGAAALVPAAPVVLAGRPPAHYDATRVATGLALAAALLAVAAWLVRRTDWTPVGDLSPVDG